MHIKPPGTERTKGDKSRFYTDIRQKLAKMERDEWRAWFTECLNGLMEDQAVWEWLTKETKFRGKFINGKYQKTQPNKGRKPHWRNVHPDTRNTDHEI